VKETVSDEAREDQPGVHSIDKVQNIEKSDLWLTAITGHKNAACGVTLAAFLCPVIAVEFEMILS